MDMADSIMPPLQIVLTDFNRFEHLESIVSLLDLESIRV
jgi:hypothetical protein